MEFTCTEHLLNSTADTLVVGIFEDNTLTPSAQSLNDSTQGQLTETIKLANFKGKEGTCLTLFKPNNIQAERVILVGLGHADKLTLNQYKKACSAAAALVKNTGAINIGVCLPEATITGHNLYSKVRCALETFDAATYSFDDFKSKKSQDKDDKKAEQTLLFEKDGFNHVMVETAVAHGSAIASSVKLTRDLANTPPNICNPEYLADMAKKTMKPLKNVHIHNISESDMRNFGMGAFLAVSQGSDEDGRIVAIEYNGSKNKHDKPVVLVGKGVTFDTGGLSLKPPASMVSMKYDMCGAASVLATIKMAAELQLPINVVALMACVENMPSGHATRPDDVVTTMSGKTVEISNTDAEGRLVLCDTLTYAHRYEPACIIDVATLTGAVVVALGRPASGMFSNNQALADELIKAGQASFDRCWQLPLWDDYLPLLDSKVADINNIGGPEAGTITAACFLSQFTEEVEWAHLDVAATAFTTGKDAVASGRPVPLLSQFVLQRAGVVPV